MNYKVDYAICGVIATISDGYAKSISKGNELWSGSVIKMRGYSDTLSIDTPPLAIPRTI